MEVIETPVEYQPVSLVENIRQSPPIDLDKRYDEDWVRGRTIVITGGASGFGEGMARKWASNGANVIIGDIDALRGQQVVKDIRKHTGSGDVHFVRTDVTDWQSQVTLFKEAVKLSHHGGIDTVVANAGVAGADTFEVPEGLDKDAPPKPDLKTMDVNLTGVLYTTHLALFWLPRNPGSRAARNSREPDYTPRDRSLLLMGSMASLGPIPAQALYAVSKHGVLGLFRTIRASSWVHGVRVNLVCPYFIDTPIVPPSARAILAGGGMGTPEDVVDAATRFTADNRIVGRSLYVGPKMKVILDKENKYQIAIGGQQGITRAVWECYAQDFEDSELFGRNIVRLLNQFAAMRGWGGWFLDILATMLAALRKGPGGFLGRKIRR